MSTYDELRSREGTYMSHHEVGASKVSETRCTDAAAVRPVRAIRDEVNTHLALRRLNGRVCLARRNRVALAEDLEVVDQALHAVLHAGAGWRHNLVVIDLDGAGGDLVQALVDNAERLAELLHAAKVTVITVSVLTHRDVEFNL